MVDAWLPFLDSRLMARCSSWSSFLFVAAAILTIVVAAWLWRAVLTNRDMAPFALAQGFPGRGVLGLVVGMWPDIDPPTLSILDAASPPSSQAFVPAGAAIMIPVVSFYAAYS